MLEARQLDNTTVCEDDGLSPGRADCHFKLYVNKGTEGIDEIYQCTDYGDGQSMLQVHGPCKSTHFHDVNRSSAVAGTTPRSTRRWPVN